MTASSGRRETSKNCAEYPIPGPARLCNLGAAEVGALTLMDFALYVTGIDAYLEAQKPK